MPVLFSHIFFSFGLCAYQAFGALDWYFKWSLEELQKCDPTEIARLASEVIELCAQLNFAIQEKEKAEASVVSLGELIKIGKSDLKGNLDRSKANLDKASALETEKSQLEVQLNKLKVEQLTWAQTKDNLK